MSPIPIEFGFTTSVDPRNGKPTHPQISSAPEKAPVAYMFIMISSNNSHFPASPLVALILASSFQGPRCTAKSLFNGGINGAPCGAAQFWNADAEGVLWPYAEARFGHLDPPFYCARPWAHRRTLWRTRCGGIHEEAARAAGAQLLLMTLPLMSN